MGTVGIPAKYGGFETLAEFLTKHLSQNYDLTVYCSAKSYAKQPDSYNGSSLNYINLKANGVQSIPTDLNNLLNKYCFKALFQAIPTKSWTFTINARTNVKA